MSISFRDVEEILRIIDEFPVAEIRFEHHDLKLYVRRDNGAAPASSHPAPAQAVAAASQASTVQEAPVVAETAVAAAAKPSKSDVEARKRDGQIAIAAPVSGTFYSSPSPDAPPFVAVGQVVEEGTDLFIIEVMKLMNFVKSPIGGTIVSIEVGNAEPVQQEQCTMWIQPSRG